MDAADFMDNCTRCGGTGVLPHQEYGFSWPAEVREGEVAIPIQRCDECERWAGDWDAAQIYLACQFDGDGVVVWGTLTPEEMDWYDDGQDPPLDVFVITVKENL